MARKKKEAPLAAEPVAAGAEEKAPLAAPAVPPLKETHDAVAAVVAKVVPKRKPALTPHVDAVEQMGLGMLRMSIALALLLPLSLFGAAKASSSLIAQNDRELVVFAMSSGGDMTRSMEYDLDSPCEVGQVTVLAPGKAAGTSVTLKRRRAYSLPYVSGRTYHEFAVAAPSMTPGSYSQSVGPAVWLTYKTAESPYTNRVAYRDAVYTNRADGAVSTNRWFVKDAVGLARLEYANDSTWGTGPYLQAVLQAGSMLAARQTFCYSISSNAVFSGSTRDTKTWTYLGTKGGSSPFQTVGSAYWPDDDPRILYCPAWRDGDFRWTWTNSNYFAMRDGEFLPLVTNRTGSTEAMVDAYASVLREIVEERSYDPFTLVATPYAPPSLSVATYTGYPAYGSQDYEVSDLTPGEPVDVWWFTPRHDASYVAVWGSKSGTHEETVGAFSLTNGMQTVDFAAPLVLAPGDVLEVSGGVGGVDAYRVTFTGRR